MTSYADKEPKRPTKNIHLLKRILQEIKANEDNFNYLYIIDDTEPLLSKSAARRLRKHSCGTTGCVAGWALALSPQLQNAVIGHDLNSVELMTIIGKRLGLTGLEARFLFCPWQADVETSASRFTNTDAIDRLEYIISGNDVAEYPTFKAPIMTSWY